MKTSATLQILLEPASISVIGASDDLSKPGGKLVRNILLRGYAGELLLVNPKASEVQGVLHTLPSPHCRRSGTGVHSDSSNSCFLQSRNLPGRSQCGGVLSAGFGEVSAEGRAQERRLVDVANSHGMLLIGPNCSGIVSHAHASKFSGVPP